MRDDMEFDTVPAEEDCAQLGQEGYEEKARKEAHALIGQLKRQFGEPPQGAKFRIKSNPHDKGISDVVYYYSVSIVYDDQIPEAVDYAFKIESEFPAQWDEQAKKELGEQLHPFQT